MNKFLIPCGAILAMLAVLLGAFGAHMLKGMYSDQQLAWHQTAFQYQMYHALAIILTGLMSTQIKLQRLLTIAGICFLVGVV